MPGKTWTNTKRDIRDLTRHIRKGTRVYTVANVSRHVAPYEDAQLYETHTFDWRSPVTGHWMSGHLSVEGLLAQYGTVYEQPPRGVRGQHEPAPQVAGPLPAGYEGVLDHAELRGLEKQVADGSDPRMRRRLGGWRV